MTDFNPFLWKNCSVTYINCFLGFFFGETSGRLVEPDTELLSSNGTVAVVFTKETDTDSVDVVTAVVFIKLSIVSVGDVGFFISVDVILCMEWFIGFAISFIFSLLLNKNEMKNEYQKDKNVELKLEAYSSKYILTWLNLEG